MNRLNVPFVLVTQHSNRVLGDARLLEGVEPRAALHLLGVRQLHLAVCQCGGDLVFALVHSVDLGW